MAPTKDLLEGFLLKEEQKHHYKSPLPELNLSDHYTQTDDMNFLKDLQGGKIMSMQELIGDIEELITERETLQKEVFRDVIGVLQDINNFLASKQDKIDAVEQLKIKEKLLDIEEFRMQEKINCFRDIALLKKELRDRVAEFKERQTRINVIDELLEQ